VTPAGEAHGFMDHVKSPPLGPLVEVIGALESAGLVCALGGSGLLAALGLSALVNDWDLTTDEAPDRVRAALERFRPAHAGSSGIHRDQKWMIGAHRTECIVGFAIQSEAGVARIPTRVTGRWRGVPLGSPEAWAAAYHLLGRAPKCDALFVWLERTGADPAAIASIIAQPMPEALRERLRALPLRAPSRKT
jgi:hypothetical protein